MRWRAEDNRKNILNGDCNEKYRSGNMPTPKQRGELIVKRLENFIREGRSDTGGMSFRRWQEMAVNEFTNALLDAEREKQRDNKFMTRVIAVGGLAVITIGFWGAIVAAGLSYDRQMVAFILISAGGLLLLVFGLWGLRWLGGNFLSGRRQNRLKSIANFDHQLAQLDIEIRKRLRETIESNFK
jgi:hypothetical protein